MLLKAISLPKEKVHACERPRVILWMDVGQVSDNRPNWRQAKTWLSGYINPIAGYET